MCKSVGPHPSVTAQASPYIGERSQYLPQLFSVPSGGHHERSGKEGDTGGICRGSSGADPHCGPAGRVQ